MTLGEIKNETLKLVGITSFNVSDSSLLLQNDQTGYYLSQMNGSINRCLSDIENRHLLHRRSLTIEPEICELSDRRLSFDISDKGVSEITRVIAKSHENYTSSADFTLEDDLTLVICDYDKSYEYKIIYYPTLTRVNDSMPCNSELLLPESISSLIPYYVAGDIYIGDEPSLAMVFRNMYENGISSVMPKQTSKTGSVSLKYSMNQG